MNKKTIPIAIAGQTHSPKKPAVLDLSVKNELAVSNQGSLDLNAIKEALMDVIDPELGVNIVDLGLVYSIEITAENHINLEVTLTNPGCPLLDRIAEDIKYQLKDCSEQVTITWVWTPLWHRGMVTQEGKEQLNALGYSF